MRPTFDHRVTGTPASVWDDAGLDAVPAVAVDYAPLLVVVAHPDDETLGAGGLIAATARRGVAVSVLIATDGENSHPDSPTHTPTQLARLRRAEGAAAVSALAPHATVGHLGLPDGALASYADTLDSAVLAFLDPLEQTAGRPVRVVTPWRADGHPDHEACAAAVVRLSRERRIEHWQFPVWAWHWGDPHGDDLPWPRLRRVEMSEDDRAAKRAALAEHVTQHQPLSDRAGDEVLLSAQLLAHFARPYECFVVPAAATQPDYFDALYAAASDPWELAGGFYEERKRAVLLASLPRPRFRRAFEPGCAIGLLTEQLAPVCDELLAWDVADAAVAQTVRRVEGIPGPGPVVERGRMPESWPDGEFDLIVLSEVGYYCDDLELLRDRVMTSLADDGLVVGCHWRHATPDYPRRAEDVHAVFDAVLPRDVHHVEEDFVLDVWSRRGVSVARADGVL